MGKNGVAKVFDRAAPAYDQIGPAFFARSGRRLVELARIAAGAAVLDVATGQGAILFPAAERVGSRGRVVGVDLSAGMLHELDVKGSRLEHVSICQMDAERLAFPAARFDAVLCGHAIYYFTAAAREFRRVLRPGGSVGATIIAQGCFDWLWEALGAYVPQDALVGDEAERQDAPAIDTPEGLEQLLSGAGFTAIRVVEEETDFVYVDKEAWWATMWTLGLRGAMESMEPAALESFKRDIFARLQPLQRADGVHVLFRVLYALGARGH